MVFSNNLLMGAAGQATGYDIEQSIRFNDDDSPVLDRTFASAGNRKTWTWSGWVKRSSNSEQAFFAAGDNSSNRFGIRFSSAANGAYLGVFDDISAATSLDLQSEKNFVDFAAWYHIVVAVDTTQSTASNRCKVYVNGNQITDFNNADYMGQNTDTSVNNTVTHRIGRLSYNTAQKFDGYLAEINFIDGSQLAPANFGETSSTTGQWVPIKYAGSYGTNGFYIDGADSSFLGKDAKATSAAVTNKASTSSEWDGETGAYTFATNEIDRSSTVNAIISSDLLSGDFSFDFTMTTSGGALRVGVIDDQEYDTFNGTGDDGGMDSMTNSFYLDKGNNQFRYGGASQGSASGVVNGAAVTIERTGSTIKITDDGSDAHTFSQTFSGPVRVVISGGGAAFNLDDVQYTADGASGNDNSFFSSGLAAADQVTDSPTDNFATWNPVSGTSTNAATFSDGNLTAIRSSGGTNIVGSTASFPATGNWYAEFTIDATGSGSFIWQVGIIEVDDAERFDTSEPRLGQAAKGYAYTTNWSGSPVPSKQNNNSAVSYGTAGSATDVIGVHLNNGTLVFYHNNVSQGTAYSSITGEYIFAWSGQSGAKVTANFGQSGFTYTPPTGAVALSTANLDDPTIADPSAHFQTTLYTGDGVGSGSGGQEINQSGNSTFKPDFVWNRVRNLGTETHCLQDVVRGANKRLQSNSNAAENTETEGLLSFDSDGFTVGSRDPYNKNTANYVAWQWLADNTTGSSNTDGSITSTVSANTTSGFSIGTYTGNGTDNATVGHGLGGADMVWVKRLNTTGNWRVYEKSTNKNLFLDLTNAGTSPTEIKSTSSTTFTLGSGNGYNGSGDSHVFYAFESVDGYSKISNYEGNGSTDGPFVYLGFKPRFLFVRRVDGADGWNLIDTARGSGNFGSEAGSTGTNPTAGNEMNAKINANDANAEEDNPAGSRKCSFLSNGFKVKNTNTAMNASGGDYLYMAFAESPFKTATAR